ncbi:MAG: hypothetical protein JJU03_05875, partial [Idiomarina sp.]|nr:hypothetical protein [Idiomarina sp.]
PEFAYCNTENSLILDSVGQLVSTLREYKFQSEQYNQIRANAFRTYEESLQADNVLKAFAERI